MDSERPEDNGDEAGLTEAEIDELFEATQLIGNALNTLAAAELAAAVVGDLLPETEARLDCNGERVTGGA